MCTLYERITALCKEKGVSGSRMCLDLGMSKSTLSDIKSGRKKGISTATAQKFANYLGVSVGYLLGGIEDEIEKSPVETAERHFEILMDEDFVCMFEDFSNLDEQQRKIVSDLVRSLAKQNAEV